MTKSRTAFYNIIIISALNIAYFFCNYYPRHIVELKDDILVSALLIITNLLHFALMSFTLTLAFGEGSCIYSDKMFRRFLPKGRYIKKLLLLLTSYVIIDFARFALAEILDEYHVFLDDFALLICWLAAYLILSDKESRFYNDKRRMIITSIVLAAAVLIFALIDAMALQRYHISAERYIASGTVLKTIAMNLEYMHSLRLVLLDLILGAALIIAHIMPIKEAEKPKKAKNQGGVFGTFFRIFIIYMMALVFCAVKTILCLFSSISTTSIFGASYFGTAQEGEFSEVENDETSIIRCGGTFGNKTEDIVSLKVKTTIYFENQKAAEISINGDPFFSCSTESGLPEKSIKNFILEEVGDVTVWIYRNRCLCWEENDEPIVIRYEDIGDQNENVTLTAVCERLIAQGNIVVFDYAKEYLEKYDHDFIEQYIIRYAAGEFTEAEREFIRLYEYREEYVMLISV